MIDKHINNSNGSKVILHLIDTTGPGGAETVFIQLADKLRQSGNKSIVIIRGKGWVEDELLKRGVKAIIIPAKGSFAFKFLWQLTSQIRLNKVDIIQSHLLGSNVYAAIAGLVTRTPVVATYHGMVDVNPNERFKWLKNVAMKWGISRYVAVSQRLLNNIQQQNLLVPEKSLVIYNGVDIERYKQPSTSSLRRQLGLNKGVLIIGCLGNVRPAKAYEVLIEAGAKILEKYPQTHFIIAGDKKKSIMLELQKQLEHLNIENHFHFIGFIDNSAEFLSQLDVFVLSSSSEGFSISTIEAMASELPVVVTQCGGPEEIVNPDSNAVMVEINNPQQLSDGIIKLIENPAFSKAIAINARAHIIETFSLDKMLKSYNDLYSKLIN